MSARNALKTGKLAVEAGTGSPACAIMASSAVKAGACQQRVDQREDPCAFDECVSVSADLAREGDKDTVNLGLFFFEEADELVILLDGFERLYIHRLAR